METNEKTLLSLTIQLYKGRTHFILIRDFFLYFSRLYLARGMDIVLSSIIAEIVKNMGDHSKAGGYIYLSETKDHVLISIGDHGEECSKKDIEDYLEGKKKAWIKNHPENSGSGLNIILGKDKKEHYAALGVQVELLDKKPGIHYSLIAKKNVPGKLDKFSVQKAIGILKSEGGNTEFLFS